MESAAVPRSFNCTTSYVRSVLERPSMIPVHNVVCLNSSKLPIQGLTFGRKHVSFAIKWEKLIVSCVRASATNVTAKSDDNHSHGALEKKSPQSVIFPDVFKALVMEVCDKTEVAEVKLKVGDFEMHLKRNIGATKAPMPVVSPTTPPPIPSKPMIESAPSASPPSPPKSSTEKVSPFKNFSTGKSAKLAALEASGASGYVLVSSSIVGSFRRGRTLKGKKQPPSCKEGDIIKEGQVIGFLDQFGTELPVKSDVAGEVIKLLFDDGDAIGYGDPLIAVLPSFHGIE